VGTATVLAHLARPYDGPRAAAAHLGLPGRLARQLVGASLATSPEVEHLLESMSHIVRSMAIATTDRPERCYGELRGPILWSETMSARSASAGDPGLWVCATTTKAYDTDENRVLKAALAAIRKAGLDAEAGSGDDHADRIKRARQNGQRAYHLLEHRTLADVPVTRITGRSMRRTRAGSRRGTYQPAVDVLLRAADPLQAEDVDRLADDATRAQIELLAAVLDASAARGRALILRTSHGQLVGGPVAYDHLAGVTVAGHLVTSAAEAVEAVERAEAAVT
jgi:hypothetical protein